MDASTASVALASSTGVSAGVAAKSGLPSTEDLDRLAEEERVKAATGCDRFLIAPAPEGDGWLSVDHGLPEDEEEVHLWLGHAACPSEIRGCRARGATGGAVAWLMFSQEIPHCLVSHWRPANAVDSLPIPNPTGAEPAFAGALEELLAAEAVAHDKLDRAGVDGLICWECARGSVGEPAELVHARSCSIGRLLLACTEMRVQRTLKIRAL